MVIRLECPLSDDDLLAFGWAESGWEQSYWSLFRRLSEQCWWVTRFAFLQCSCQVLLRKVFLCVVPIHSLLVIPQF